MIPKRTLWHLLNGVLAVSAVLFAAAPSAARPVLDSEKLDRTEQLPARLQGIDVKEHLGDLVPKGTEFVDDTGKPVKLGDYLDGKRPVILTLNYSRCPMLCGLELNGLVASLKQLDWAVGGNFEIVTVVLDPKETPAQAAEAKARYVRQYGRDGAANGWHFLTGSEASVKAVANSVGFLYGFNEARNEYIHPAAIMVLSPEGKIARYLYGIQYHPKTMRLSLVEAGEGKIGSSIDQLVLYCFHYDAKEGSYAPVAMNIMRVSSGLGATALGGFLASFFVAESRKRKKKLLSTGNDGSSGSSKS
ncbi:MAG TPA: SCO family protein [Polyangiaceae bacterium]|jgi:protein SCO1/2|nr:SCO family protein [Polyangiaceae bacterium]